MDTFFRTIAVYFVLLIVLRASGKRSLAQITSFDFILLLILGESTQPALTGNDYSVTTSVLVVVTLIGVDMTLSFVKQRFKRVDKWIDSVPLVIVADGEPLRDRMAKSRVDESDVLAAARERHGLERMDQIKYAVLERSGGISIIPVK